MRLKHPDMRPTGSPVRLRFDGREIEALEGETIAAALAASDIVAVRQARSGAPRGPFCGMGVCFDCLVTVDGRPSQRACLTKVAAGMDVRSSPDGRRPRPSSPRRPAEEIACDVLVVGAGPGRPVGGARAGPGRRRRGRARRAAPSGRPVLQAAGALAPGRALDPRPPVPRRRGAGAVDAAGRRARIVNEATVWAAFSPHEVAAIVAGHSQLYRPKRLVLATGAYEQSPTSRAGRLPGVMTVGGLQTLARSYRVAPGERIVIAGNGPLCLQTAVELLDGGANVVAVLEAAPRPGLAQARALASAAHGRSLPDDRRPFARRPSRRQAALEPPGDAADRRRSRARHRGGRSPLRRRHRGAELRLRLVVGAGALAGLRPSLRAARQRLDGDADRRQTAAPASPRSSPSATARASAAPTRRWRRARWPPPPSPRDLGLKIAEPREARRTLRRAARFQAALVAPVRRAADRSRRDRRRRRRLPLRGGDGRRAARPDRRRPRFARRR